MTPVTRHVEHVPSLLHALQRPAYRKTMARVRRQGRESKGLGGEELAWKRQNPSACCLPRDILKLAAQNILPQPAATTAIAFFHAQAHSMHHRESASGRLTQQDRYTTVPPRVNDPPSSLMRNQEMLAQSEKTQEDLELLDPCHQKTRSGAAAVALKLSPLSAAPCAPQTLRAC